MTRRASPASSIGRLFERQRAAAAAALQAKREVATSHEPERCADAAVSPVLSSSEGGARAAVPSPEPKRGDEAVLITPAEPGALRIEELRLGQCRYACTADDAPRDAHRFCGRPTRIQRGNLDGSWCDEHLRMVWAAVGRPAGGLSRARAAGGEREQDHSERVGRSGWGHTGSVRRAG